MIDSTKFKIIYQLTMTLIVSSVAVGFIICTLFGIGCEPHSKSFNRNVSSFTAETLSELAVSLAKNSFLKQSEVEKLKHEICLNIPFRLNENPPLTLKICPLANFTMQRPEDSTEIVLSPRDVLQAVRFYSACLSGQICKSRGLIQNITNGEILHCNKRAHSGRFALCFSEKYLLSHGYIKHVYLNSIEVLEIYKILLMFF